MSFCHQNVSTFLCLIQWNFFDKLLPYGVIKIKKNNTGHLSRHSYMIWGEMYSQAVVVEVLIKGTIMQFSWCVHVQTTRAENTRKWRNGSGWRALSSPIFFHGIQ